MEKYNFKSVLAHLHTFHGIHLNTDTFEEYALHAWDKIGNKEVGLYTYSGPTSNRKLKIPCNVDIIEAVTSDEVDFQKTDNIRAYNYTNLAQESMVEADKTLSSPYYTSGKLLEFQIIEDELIFKRDYPKINILYKGLILDEEGFPYLNYKEVEAVANYCAYVETRKKGMVSKDKATIEISQLLKAEWEKSCAHARTPIYLNQNQLNEILEAQNSWDRKRYSTSFKPSSR
jgi:hypothetical protein